MSTAGVSSQPSKSMPVLSGPRIRSALFEIATQEPEHAPRLLLRALAALFAILLAWAAFARLDIVAVARGRLVPQTHVKIVQPTNAGLVREILVKEGDFVDAGHVLARLDPTNAIADRATIEHDLAMQRLQLRRIDAELVDRPMRRGFTDDARLFAQLEAQREAHRREFAESLAAEAAARDQARRELAAAQQVLEKLDKTLPSYRRSADAFEKLAGEQLVGSLQAEERRREAVEKAQDLEAQRETVGSLEAAVDASTRKIAQLKGAYESALQALRVEALGKIAQLEQALVKAEFDMRHLELRAPQAGVVKELATTTIGAVVQPGTVLLTLVPAREPLLAEVFIENKDIGFVRTGQVVRLKLATYPFQKYGMLEGVVRTVSADSQHNPRSERDAEMSQSFDDAASPLSFKAVIELRDQQLRVGEVALTLAAGMELSAEIIEGRRTILEYLLSPLRRVANEAGRER